uniref:Uncharacterized protein n=1 Tax=Naja naja TaxID=35670 RepID=A0A8C6XQW7_NAJNA
MGEGRESNETAHCAFRLPYDLHIESKYKARVLVTNFTSDNKTLIFSNTTEEDVGFYLCSFHTFPYGILEKRIHVVQSGAFEFSKLSVDHLITKPGENVTFIYRSNSDVAVNRMTWERVQPDCVDLIIQCADSEMPIYGSDYQNRVHCISESSILLWDVTASDYGMYRFSYDMVNGENGTGWIKLTTNSYAPLFTKLHIIFIGSSAFLILIIVVILTYRRPSINTKTRLVRTQQMQIKVLLQQMIQSMSTANRLCKIELTTLYISELPQLILLISGIRIRI